MNLMRSLNLISIKINLLTVKVMLTTKTEEKQLGHVLKGAYTVFTSDVTVNDNITRVLLTHHIYAWQRQKIK